MTLAALRRELRVHSRPEYAKTASWFFKTGPGQYGEGDCFLGVRVPDIRRIAQRTCGCDMDNVLHLLHSKWHEERSLALLILISEFDHGEAARQREVFDLYLREIRWINNWDLVDLSAPPIIGKWLLNRPSHLLHQFARSKNLWKRRIAIVSTLSFIRAGKLSDTFALSKLLLRDRHDLIHKACGWMLREAGKRDRQALENFLKCHLPEIPRTMLRYAIEKFPEPLRKSYLQHSTPKKLAPNA